MTPFVDLGAGLFVDPSEVAALTVTRTIDGQLTVVVTLRAGGHFRTGITSLDGETGLVEARRRLGR